MYLATNNEISNEIGINLLRGKNMPEEATLSNEKNYTVFQFNGHIIRFTAPYSLEYYTEVKEWDNGYLVVMAKYKQNKGT